MSKWDSDAKRQIGIYTVSGILIVLAMFFSSRLPAIGGFIARVWKTMQPFVFGFCIAFILLPIARSIQYKALKDAKLEAKSKRRIAVGISIVILIAVIVFFFSILIPQIISSVQTLVSSMDEYVAQVDRWVETLHLESQGQLESYFSEAMKKVQDFLNNWVNGENGILSRLVSYSVNVVKGIFNFFIGIIVAVYLMMDRERWKKQAKKLARAFLPGKACTWLFMIARLTINMLNAFIFGKALDSLIIGIVCGIVCGFMRMPYTPLIAVVVGLTNMIPIFGPFLGAVPCLFILLFISPIKALEFLIFIIILQQVDGNILGPHILGDSMGLPPLYVMFAIILGGALWGVLGMFLGVPLFSVVYVLVREIVNERLEEKAKAAEQS